MWGKKSVIYFSKRFPNRQPIKIIQLKSGRGGVSQVTIITQHC